MKKGNLYLRTILSTLAAALGLAVPAMADDEDLPEVEREIVKMDPLYFEGVDPADEDENQRLWNELMKYKLWGTEYVLFNKGNFRIAEPSGYTGSAVGKIYFRNGYHTLGGPVLAGTDLEISYPGIGADNDSLFGGPVRANWLVLPNSYKANGTYYNAVFCFKDSYYTEAEQERDESARKFVENVHNAKGKVFADWGDSFGLDGPYPLAKNAIKDKTMKNRNTHPLRERLTYWFDNRMSEGFLPKVRLLLLITLLFVLLMGTLAALAHGHLSGKMGEDFLRTIMYALGKGGALTTEDTSISILYFAVMLITILYCMFFSVVCSVNNIFNTLLFIFNLYFGQPEGGMILDCKISVFIK